MRFGSYESRFTNRPQINNLKIIEHMPTFRLPTDGAPCKYQMSRNVRKRTFEYVLPAKIQISLHIRAVWSKSSLGAFWITKDATYHQWRLWSDFAYAQADLSLRWVHMSEGTFSHVEAQIVWQSYHKWSATWEMARMSYANSVHVGPDEHAHPCSLNGNALFINMCYNIKWIFKGAT